MKVKKKDDQKRKNSNYKILYNATNYNIYTLN